MMAAVNYASPLVTKPSRAEWLGAVPVDWEIKKMKYLFRDHSQKGQPDATLLSVTQGQGVVPRTWVENRMVMPSGNLESFKFIKKDDFAISLRSFEGGLEYCHHDGIISPAYTVLKRRHSNLDSGYYRYLFKSHAFISELQTSVVGIREGKNISFEELSYSLMPIPPLSAQRSIAVFLDGKCAKIDEAVKIKEDQIALLRERRQIIIQDAVTRGLNPAAPMKDSGIDWIGKIPSHWNLNKLRHAFKFNKGLTITKENLQDEGIPCVNYGEVHSKYGFEVDPSRHPLRCVDQTYVKNNQASLLKRGDFVFADTSEDIEGSGNFTYFNSDNQAFAGYHTLIAKPKMAMNERFIAYLLDSRSFRAQVQTEVKGVKVFSISQSILKDAFVWFPPSNEQDSIAAFLDEECSRIDAAVNIKEKQITAFKEYKTSLINAAVTGKIKVV